MSQPKPTGEWFRDSVQEIRFNSKNEDQAIADAHNAALAEYALPFIESNLKLREQLVAEREKVQALNDALKRISKSPFIVANMVSVAQDALAKEGK